MGTSPASPHLPSDVGRRPGFPRRITPFLASVRTLPRSTPAQTGAVIESRPHGVYANTSDLTGKRKAPAVWRCASDDVTCDRLTDGSSWFLTHRREAASAAVPLGSCLRTGQR